MASEGTENKGEHSAVLIINCSRTLVLQFQAIKNQVSIKKDAEFLKFLLENVGRQLMREDIQRTTVDNNLSATSLKRKSNRYKIAALEQLDARKDVETLSSEELSRHSDVPESCIDIFYPKQECIEGDENPSSGDSDIDDLRVKNTEIEPDRYISAGLSSKNLVTSFKSKRDKVTTKRKSNLGTRGKSPKTRLTKRCKTQNKCSRCGDLFATNEELTRHKSAVHHLTSGGDIGKVIAQMINECVERNHVICYSCGEIFNEMKMFPRHLYFHERELRDVYNCLACSDCFESLDGKVLHEVQEHGAEELALVSLQVYKCEDCGKGFQQRKNLVRHQNNVKKCTETDQVTKGDLPNSRMRFSYIANVAPSTKLRKGVGCLQCPTVSYDDSLLLDHLAEAHGISENSKCVHCQLDFNSNTHLLKHCPPVWVCEDCGWTCAMTTVLHYCRAESRPNFGNGFYSHVVKELLEYVCCSCPFKTQIFNGKIESKSQSMVKHLNVSHISLGESNGDSSTPFACAHCGKNFSDIRTLRLHGWYCKQKSAGRLNRKVPGATKTTVPDKPIQCPVCAKTFAKKNNYYQHKANMHGPKKPCKVCGLLCRNTMALYLHNKTHRGMSMHEEVNPKEWTCETCGLQGVGNSKYHRHKQDHKERRFKCDVCSHAFPSNAKLIIHMKGHTGEKTCFCEFCGRGFINPANHRLHVMTHTGERPFKCKVCAQAFTNKRDTRRHIDKHHDVKKDEISHYIHHETAPMRINNEQQNTSGQPSTTHDRT